MSPPLGDVTRDLGDLVRLAAKDDAIEDLLRRGLDWMGRVAPFDLATVFELQGDALVVRTARGPLASRRVVGHRLSLSAHPQIHRVVESRRAQAMSLHDHESEGDPFDGVFDFPPGHACMVVPLAAGDTCFGVATLDRRVCEPYADQVVELVEVYAQVLAIAIRNAQQRLLLERLRLRDGERIELLEKERASNATELLEASRSALTQQLVWKARQVAPTVTPVLLLGETGTGKERLARAIHSWSQRSTQPFVAINCAAIPTGLLESELFGHVRGAFTGAAKDRAGRFQLASGGTLLLDEIGELPLELQAKLLRVLQEGQVEPVGSDRSVAVDVRIIAATHVDLEAAIREQRFREDLYYRLSVFPLRVPALRERLEDLELACRMLLEELSKRTGRRCPRLSTEALQKLSQHHWPGNLRELGNVLERATILTTAAVLGPDDLEVSVDAPHLLHPRVISNAAQLATLDQVQANHIRRVLAATEGRIYGPRGAAAILGLKPSTLQSKMRKLGIERRIVVDEAG